MADSNLTLDAVARELADNTARAQHMLDQHDPSALVTPPAPGAWSVAQCIAHLKVTTDLYRLPIAELINRQRERGRFSEERQIRPGWFAGWFITQASPEGRRKLPAPRAFRVGAAEAVGIEVVNGFLASQGDLDVFIKSCRGLDLNRGKLASPVTRLIRFTLGETFLLLARHQARHVDQAERAIGG